MPDDRRERGLARMRELFGDGFSPALGDPLIDLTVDHLFADIWTRPGLELRERSLITCAALAALGKGPQLKGHLRGALHVGISPKAIEDPPGTLLRLADDRDRLADRPRGPVENQSLRRDVRPRDRSWDRSIAP